MPRQASPVAVHQALKQPGPAPQASPNPSRTPAPGRTGYEARGNVSGVPMMVRSLSNSRDSRRDTCI